MISVLCILLFSFPVFAEDEAYIFQNIGYEALALQNEDVNQYLIDLYQEERNNQIAQILSEPLNNSLRSIDVEGNNVFFNVNRVGENLFYFTSIFLGYEIEYFDNRYLAFTNLPNTSNINFNSGTSPFSGYFSLPDGATGVYSSYRSGSTRFNSPSISKTSLLQENIDPIYPERTEYLSNVAEVFTWILNHIGDMITFIFANAFLSISLLLFMCGAVISFFVKVKRS